MAGSLDMRLFYVASTGRLTLSNLTLFGGSALGLDGGGRALYGGNGGGAAGMGGAIFNRGVVILHNVTIIASAARGGRGGV
ncbi:MAG TPA: hypothetical protein VLV78_08095 [Thermoanaerobaculia bacterium]|nr:hypothetical protein [Thermoanaerobaculia bacterium]